uniref:Uncharacterized protein n=2 Tax=Hemiselmis andersenii TaxID=464988 RepID=A0A6U2BD30_HEMAN
MSSPIRSLPPALEHVPAIRHGAEEEGSGLAAMATLPHVNEPSADSERIAGLLRAMREVDATISHTGEGEGGLRTLRDELRNLVQADEVEMG